MGCTSSITGLGRVNYQFNGQPVDLSKDDAYAFPPWCMKCVQIDSYVKDLVSTSWNILISGQSPTYKELTSRPETKSVTPLVFFYNTFYDAFFSLAPEVKPLFKRGIAAQGRMLSHVINFIVNHIDKDDEFEDALRYLAIVHNQRGVDDQHYSTMGLTLLFALRRCLGEALFTNEVRYAWICVFSRIMQVMIPIVVSKRMHHDLTILKRIHEYRPEEQPFKPPQRQLSGVDSNNLSPTNSLNNDSGWDATNTTKDTRSPFDLTQNSAVPASPSPRRAQTTSKFGSKLDVGNRTFPGRIARVRGSPVDSPRSGSVSPRPPPSPGPMNTTEVDAGDTEGPAPPSDIETAQPATVNENGDDTASAITKACPELALPNAKRASDSLASTKNEVTVTYASHLSGSKLPSILLSTPVSALSAALHPCTNVAEEFSAVLPGTVDGERYQDESRVVTRMPTSSDLKPLLEVSKSHGHNQEYQNSPARVARMLPAHGAGPVPSSSRGPRLAPLSMAHEACISSLKLENETSNHSNYGPGPSGSHPYRQRPQSPCETARLLSNELTSHQMPADTDKVEKISQDTKTAESSQSPKPEESESTPQHAEHYRGIFGPAAVTTFN